MSGGTGARAAEEASRPGDEPAPLPADRPAPLGAAGWAIVGLVSLANLVPVWGLRYFPGQDTPNHLYAVEVLRALDGHTAGAALRRAFVATLGLKTNVAFHLLALELSRVVPLATAHRLILSAYAIAFPLAGLFCVSRAAPRSRHLALLLLPLAWSWFAVQGLYNYVFSLVPALFWLGIVARAGVRGNERMSPRAGFGLALAAAAVYLAHVGTFVAMLFVTAVRVLRPGDGTRARPLERIRAAAPLLVALVPAFLCAVIAFFGALHLPHPAPEPTVSRLEWSDPLTAFATFFLEFALRYRPWELIFLLPPLIALLAFPLRAALRRWRERRPLADPAAPAWPLTAALGLAVLYFTLPHILLGSDASPRLRPLLVFCLLCYGGVALGRKARRRVAVLALACGLGGAVALTVIGARLGRQLDDFASGIPYVREDARVYPMVFDPRAPSLLVKPFLHAWGYYGIARHVVTPFAFAWHEARFPFRYRELPLHLPSSDFPSDAEDEPYALVQGRLCAAVRRFAPSKSCADVRRETLERLAALGESYDYVLTWAAPDDFHALLSRRGYSLVHGQGELALFAPPPSVVIK